MLKEVLKSGCWRGQRLREFVIDSNGVRGSTKDLISDRDPQLVQSLP